MISADAFGRLYGRPDPAAYPAGYTPARDRVLLVALALSFGSRRVVEFGVHEGVTAHTLLRECPLIESYTGVDVEPSYVPQRPSQRHEIPRRPGHRATDPRFKLLVRPRGSLGLTPADLPAGVDFVFIDGDHGHDAVLSDTALARGLVKDGVIAWHDYRNVPDVTRAVDSLDGDVVQVVDTFVCYQLVGGAAARR